MLAMIMGIFAFCSEGYLIYTLTFLLLIPNYMCVNNTGDMFECSRE